MQLSPLNQNDLPICEYQLSALLGERWEGNVLVIYRAILCNQNVNILIERLEDLNRNIQLQRLSLEGDLQHRESEPFSLIKDNAFNTENSSKIKNLILRIEGWGMFHFQLLILNIGLYILAALKAEAFPY